MQHWFNNFEVIAHNFNNNQDTLLVRMHATGTEYTLVRGLDPLFGGRFKLEINGDFYRTPKSRNGLARCVVGNNLINVEFTSGDLTQITQAGW